MCKLFFVSVAAALCGSTFALGTMTVTGTVRDFNDTHPDFESKEVKAPVTGLVSSTLVGKDPVFVKLGDTTSITSKESFSQWFNNTPGVNMWQSLTLTLNEVSPGLFEYSNSSFFPIDGQLFGNQGRWHNYHFTFELNQQFTYKPGQKFHFTGDDDVWVYINNQLVVDLGGVHAAASGSVDLDTLGLTAGQTYDFDLYFAERHTVDSNFKMQLTGIELHDAVPGPAAALPFLVGFAAAFRKRNKR